MWNHFLSTLSVSFSALMEVRPVYALSAIGLYAVGIVIGGARWQRVLTGLGCRSRLIDTSLGNLVGLFVNNVTPLSRLGGEVSRVTLIRKLAKIDLKKATASIFYDRLAMLIPTAALLALAFPVIRHFLHNDEGYSRLLPVVTIVFLALIAVLVAFWKFDRLRLWLKDRMQILHAFRMNKKMFGEAVACGVLIWVQDVLRLMIVAAAFQVLLNPFQAATLSLVVLLCGFMPSLGGLGPTEGGLTAALHLFGVGLPTAIAITILERAISYVLGTCAGSIALMSLGGRRMLKRKEDSR